MSDNTDVIDNSALAVQMDDDVEGFFESRERTGALFFTVFDGTICQRSRNYVEGWEEVTTHHPVEKDDDGNAREVHTWVRRFDRLVGRIINIEKQKHTFEKTGNVVINYNITLLAGGKKGVLSLQYMDPVLKRFLKVSPNINLEKPILISAFPSMKDGKRKQAVSFRQGEGKDVDKWTKVPEYWQRDKDHEGNSTGPAKGADGSILVQPTQDEDDESWDYKPQNKFLVGYFKDHVLPKVQEIAARYTDVPKAANDNSTPEFSGGSHQPEREVTSKPDNFLSNGPQDAMTGNQTVQLREVCKRINMQPEEIAKKLFGTSFHLLNREAVGYLIYKAQQKASKMETADANNLMQSVMTPELKPEPVVQPKPSDDDDDWGVGTAPIPATTAVAATPKKADDDDIPW